MRWCRSLADYRMYHLGQRLNVQGDFCTVRFIGSIPNWPESAALGLEWDAVERGKNDGSINGVRYFQTENNTTSGSFMKRSSPKLAGASGVSFIRALCDKYGKGFQSYSAYTDLFTCSREDSPQIIRERDHIYTEVTIGTKTIETYGFQRLSEVQSHFQKLKVVSLSSCNVCSNLNELDPQMRIKIHEILPNLTDLDLSYNLISAFATVLDIVNLTKIEKLNLNGNRFATFDEVLNVPLVDVKELCLDSTKVIDFSFIPKYFPNLTRLTLSSNGLNDLSNLRDLAKLKDLTTLDLSYNEYTRIPISQLKEFPALQALHMSNNRLEFPNDVEFTLEKVETLDVRANCIQRWDEIDSINCGFPHLRILKINYNPMTQSYDDHPEMFDLASIQIISRTNTSLEYLNGTRVSSKERTNFELYFLSLLKREPGSYDHFFNTDRFKELCSINRENPDEISAKSAVCDSKGRLSANILTLTVSERSQKFQMKTFRYYTVANLKGIISKRIGKPALTLSISFAINNQLREVLNDDLAMLQSTGISEEEIIYVE